MQHTFTPFYIHILLISQLTIFSGFVDNTLYILKINKIGLVIKMYNFTMILKVLSTKTANVKSIKTIKLYIFTTHSTKFTNYRSHCSVITLTLYIL